MNKALVVAAAFAMSLGSGGVAHAADDTAPCLAEATSANAVATQGTAVREIAVTEGQSGTIQDVVPTLAQADDCP
jgi:hypothetical protein